MCKVVVGFKLRSDAEHYREGLLKADMPEGECVPGIGSSTT
jgi:hypothetical protein